MPVILESVTLVRETEKAILVRESDVEPEDAVDGVNQFWIPRSVIDETDLEEVGDCGDVSVRTWFAEKEGIA